VRRRKGIFFKFGSLLTFVKRSNLFDLIITDIDMPRLNGFELTEKIRESDMYKHIPIIIVSSKEKEEELKWEPMPILRKEDLINLI
jgi:CheY-like chemotaxis protein